MATGLGLGLGNILFLEPSIIFRRKINPFNPAFFKNEPKNIQTWDNLKGWIRSESSLIE